MRIHPKLNDPRAVLISVTPVSGSVRWEDYRFAALQAMAAMQIELDGETVVIKPNLTSAERFADPDSGITTHPCFVQGLVEHVHEHGVRPGGTTILADLFRPGWGRRALRQSRYDARQPTVSRHFKYDRRKRMGGIEPWPAN